MFTMTTQFTGTAPTAGVMESLCRMLRICT